MAKQKNNEQVISTPTYPLAGHEFPTEVRSRKVPAKKKQLTITFRHNRTFELHIGHEVMRFEGRQTKAVDISILKHPAFIQARKDFNIKGI